MSPLIPDGTLVSLQLIVPVAWQDTVVDWLLDHPSLYEEFVLHPAMAHARTASSPSPKEQVQGHGDGVLVHVVLPQSNWPAVQRGLLPQLARAAGRWWLTPVIASGLIGPTAGESA